MTACAGTPALVTIPPASCGKLIPSEYAKGVESARIPDNGALPVGETLTAEIAAAIIAPWALAFLDQAGQLEKANSRTIETIAIVNDCEAKVNAARPR